MLCSFALKSSWTCRWQKVRMLSSMLKSFLSDFLQIKSFLNIQEQHRLFFQSAGNLIAVKGMGSYFSNQWKGKANTMSGCCIDIACPSACLQNCERKHIGKSAFKREHGSLRFWCSNWLRSTLPVSIHLPSPTPVLAFLGQHKLTWHWSGTSTL